MTTSHVCPRLALLALALCYLPACVTVESEPPPRYVVTRTADQVTWISSLSQRLRIEAVKIGPLHFTSNTGRLARLSTVERVNQAAEGFSLAMRSGLEPRYQVVSEADEGVLVMEMTVTDLVTEPRLVGLIDVLGGEPSGQLPALGIEAHFLDGDTGELIATLITLRESPQLTYALGPDGGVEASKAAFLPLALRLRGALDRSWDWASSAPASR